VVSSARRPHLIGFPKPGRPTPSPYAKMIESVIAQAVPNSEDSDVPSMRFTDKLKDLAALDSSITQSAIWQLIHKLNKLRAAAAHKDYQSLREERFAELKKELLSTYPNTIPAGRGDSFKGGGCTVFRTS
jgi:hypothetical protein